MIKPLVLSILVSVQLYSQTYLNVVYTDATLKNSDIADLQKITFGSSGTQMSFVLANGATVTDVCDNIRQMNFGGIPAGSGLPVELVCFTAVRHEKGIMLHWSTATEANTYGFDIERKSTDTPAFAKIGFVAGSGTSSAAHAYSFTDNAAARAGCEYRLRLVDNGGGYTYSRSIAVAPVVPLVFALEQNFPNPFNPATLITYCLPSDGYVTMKVYDVMGREAASLRQGYERAGRYSVSFDGTRLASGVYYCMLRAGTAAASIKLLLMK